MAFWQWMGFAVAAAILCMTVRVHQPQMAGVCAAAAGLILVIAALENLGSLQEMLARLTALAGLNDGYLGTLLKVLGISYVAELAAQTCADLGEKGLSLKVGLMGRLCVFSIAAPLLIEMLEIILELVP